MPSEEELLPIFGNNIRNVRIAKGLQQEEVAEKVGLSEEQYRLIEEGKLDIEVTTYYKIAAALGLDKPSVLLEGG